MLTNSDAMLANKERPAPSRTSRVAVRDRGERGLGPVLQALVRVRLADGIEPDDFEAYLRLETAVVDAWRLASDTDYEVRLACRSLGDLNAAVTALRCPGGAAVTSTSLVLHRVSLDVSLDTAERPGSRR